MTDVAAHSSSNSSHAEAKYCGYSGPLLGALGPSPAAGVLVVYLEVKPSWLATQTHSPSRLIHVSVKRP